MDMAQDSPSQKQFPDPSKSQVSPDLIVVCSSLPDPISFNGQQQNMATAALIPLEALLSTTSPPSSYFKGSTVPVDAEPPLLHDVPQALVVTVPSMVSLDPQQSSSNFPVISGQANPLQESNYKKKGSSDLPKNLDLDLGSPSKENSITPPSRAGNENSSLLVLPSEAPSPDPRWPSIFRWSANSGPPFSATAVEKVQLANASSSEAIPSPTGISLIRIPIDSLANQVEPQMEVSALDDGSPVNPIEVEITPSVDSTPLTPTSKGAWAKPLPISSSPQPSLNSSKIADISELWPSLKSSSQIQVTRQLRKEVHVPKIFKDVLQVSQKLVDRVEDDIRFPWAAKMHPASRNLYRAIEPEFLDDGTPKVTIPRHVMLQGLEYQKEYILGQFYRCLPPPGGLIYAVSNKLWGRKCKITIRKLGESNYLFHIPDESTRSWVLQMGLWHVDDCLMFVAPWAPEATLDIPEIKTIPIWVTLKKIPNILYSIPGISHLASGLGAPMATYKPRLDPILMGEAKILVEDELTKAFPTRIAASDEKGFISMVDVEYAWLPTKCSTCGQLGHKVKRCIQSVTNSQVDVANAPSSDPLATNHSSNNLSISGIEVPSSNLSTLPTIDPITVDPTPATTAVEQIIPATFSAIVGVPGSTHPTMQADITIPEAIESPTQENAQCSSLIVGTLAIVQKDNVNQDEHILGSNRFASLDSPEGEEESSVLDYVSGSMDLMTPSGKRILRERPVKPSVKAKEVEFQSTGRGRGNRGRGNRGGRG